MNAYCQRQGLALGSVRFLFDGIRLTQHQTPGEVRSPMSPPHNTRLLLSHFCVTQDLFLTPELP